MKLFTKYEADKVAFFVCLTLAAALFIGGFFVPPMGQIDGSVLKAGGILLAFAAIGVMRQSIKDGKEAKFVKGDLSVTIGDKDDEDTDSCIGGEE